MKDKIGLLKKYDIILAFVLFILLSAVVINKILLLNVSLALFNFCISLIPAVYMLFVSKKWFFNRKSIYIFTIIIIRIITSLLSFNELNNENIIIQVCYDISLTINLCSIYLVIANIIPTEKFEFKYINYILIFISLVFSIYNIIDGLDNYVYFTNIKYRYLINFSSFFSNKNLFGQLLIFGLFSTHIELQKKKSKFLNFTKYFLIFNLLLTISRTAILAYIVFVFIKLIFEKKYSKIVLILFLILIIFVLNLFNIRNLIFTFVIRSDALTSGRTEIWNICLQYFYKSPIIGYGELHISNIIDNITGVTSMHNWAIKLLLNGGIINFVCYAVILITVFKKLLNVVKNKVGNNINIYLAIFVSLISYGLFEEINLFEFGWSNICFTYFIIILPVLMSNSMKGLIK